jgi:hypothetical protein
VFKFIARLFKRKPRIAHQPVRPSDPDKELVVTFENGRAVVSDQRLIERMTFGLNETTAEARAASAMRVRRILLACECHTGGDIAKLGCTGVFHHLGVRGFDGMNAVQVGQFLRLGLAGGGVGLACFVPPSRFCYIHNTIGGREPGQDANYTEQAVAISRKLTPAEQAKVAVTERARRVYAGGDDKEAAALLTGFNPEAAVEAVTAAVGGIEVEELPPLPWVCQEHHVHDPHCRYCVAQRVVEGPLDPTMKE